ncbi:ATP-binding protein [Streptomyces sp. NPDC002787]
MTTSEPRRPASAPVPPGAVNVSPISHIPEAVRTLRHRARALLTCWGLSPDVVDEAVLVISELATNAIEHALPPAELRLSLAWADGRRVLRIEVSDGGPAPRPSTTPDGPDLDESGRGLPMVAALSFRHGAHLASARTTRWAELPVGISA